MTMSEIDRLEAGNSGVKRLPGGYWCRVLVVDRWRKKVKLRDDHSRCHRYWVSFKTLIEQWGV